MTPHLSFLQMCLSILAVQLAWAFVARIAFRIWRDFKARRRIRGVEVDVVLRAAADERMKEQLLHAEQWERNARERARVIAEPGDPYMKHASHRRSGTRWMRGCEICADNWAQVLRALPAEANPRAQDPKLHAHHRANGSHWDPCCQECREDWLFVPSLLRDGPGEAPWRS